MNSNKRTIVIQEKTYTSLESAAKAFGKSRNTVDYRLSKGWTPEQTVGLVPPPDFASKNAGIPVKVEGLEFKNLKAAAKHYNRAYTHVIEMLKKGRSIEQALGLIPRYESLQSKKPELAKQWHPDKNMLLTPNDVSSGSGKKVWWICSKNHEWKAVISSRNQGIGCPYCAGQRPTTDRNFATKYPELLKELDFIKNNNLDPEKLSPRASQKVWWKCNKDHSWQATISNRTRRQYNNACPYCTNRKLCNENSLARLRPDIAQDWHPTKNNALTPSDVIAGGGIKVWWICKHGHEWQATVGTRVNNSTGCPKCTLHTSRIEIAVYSEMLALFPDSVWQEKIERYECDIFIKNKNIGIEIDGVYWHRQKSNVDKTKSKLFDEKGIQLFRLREHGLPLLSERDISFKWSDKTFPIISRLVQQILKFAQLTENERLMLHQYISGISLINEKQYRKIVSHLPAPPSGRSLADKMPDIAKEWAYDLNAPLTPEHFGPSANKSAWWRCIQGHVWKSVIQQRTFRRSGCLRCSLQRAPSENSLAVIRHDLAKEWNSEKNGNLHPEKLFPNSNLKVWWVCNKGHEWQAVISSRNSNVTGCPYCYGRYASKTNNLAMLYPFLLVEWDAELNKGLNPSDFTPHVNKKVWWRCQKRHSYEATIYNRTKNQSGCPICARNNSRKYSIVYFQEFAIKRGGKCLSDEYLNGKTKITMICKIGHQWKSRADDIIYEQRWCSLCSKISVLLEQLTIF